MSIIVNQNGQAYKDSNGKVLSGIQPTVNVQSLSVTANGTYPGSEFQAYAPVVVNVPNPSSGNLNITDMLQHNVTDYATAQVVDSDIVSSNIVQGANILGVEGSAIVPSGNLNIIDLAQHNVTAYATAQVVDSNLVASNIKKDVSVLGVIGTLETGSDIQVNNSSAETNSTSLTATSLSITVTKTGIYTVSWSGAKQSSSGTFGSRLYIGSSAYGSENTSFTRSYYQYNKLINVSLSAGNVVTIYARSRGSGYYMSVSNLIIEKTS